MASRRDTTRKPSTTKAKSTRTTTAAKTKRPQSLESLLTNTSAQALLTVSIAAEYGTVDTREWDDRNSETVDVASREKSEDDLHTRTCFGTGGVPRNRAWVSEIGRESRPICGSNAPEREFVLVKVLALR